MYYFFVIWIARPIYRFIIKPFLFICRMVQKVIGLVLNFIYYLFVCLTGNFILAITLGSLTRKYIDYSSDASPLTTLLAIVSTISFALICFLIVGRLVDPAIITKKSDYFKNEPQFIKNIVQKIHKGFQNIIHGFRHFKEEVKKSDEEIQVIKRKKREKKNAQKVIKMAKKRIRKEEKIQRELEEKKRLDIIHNRSEIIDL